MNRAAQLAKRRTMLIAECKIQRAMLRTQNPLFGGGVNWFKSGGTLVERIKNMPGWANLLIAGAVILIPGRATKLARSALMLWQFMQSMKEKKTDQS